MNGLYAGNYVRVDQVTKTREVLEFSDQVTHNGRTISTRFEALEAVNHWNRSQAETERRWLYYLV